MSRELIDTPIITGVEPKRKCKIKFIQKWLIKKYGYRPIYKMVKAYKVKTTPDDWKEQITELPEDIQKNIKSDGTLTFTWSDE